MTRRHDASSQRRKSVVFLVRHCETEANRLGILTSEWDTQPLTIDGKRQARLLADVFREAPIKSVVSSPVLRARQTASVISTRNGFPLRIDERLAEPDFGPKQGQPVGILSSRTYEEHGFESWSAIAARVRSCVHAYGDQNPVIFVTHADPIRAYLSLLIGIDEMGSEGIVIRGGSITVVDMEGEKPLAIGVSKLNPSILARISAH